MDEYTGAVLAVQLTALAGIACSLLLYLALKARRAVASDGLAPGIGRSVLVTAADTGLGLQLSLRLVSAGFRVFAGLRGQPDDQDAARVLRAKLKALEAARQQLGTLILVSLDVTREDSLHEAVDAVRRHLPVGENGLWAVINTSGAAVKGKLEMQESCQWESMFKVNVVGTLRTARAFLPLLKPTKGRLVTVGLSGECHGQSTGAVAYAAARHAVVGASEALAHELAHTGVTVVTVNTGPITADTLYRRVAVRAEEGKRSDAYLTYPISALPDWAAEALDEALLSGSPRSTYNLKPPTGLARCLTSLSARLHPHKTKALLQSV